MKLSIRRFGLNLTHTWRIARGTGTSVFPVVFAELSDDRGLSGLGESAPIQRYNENVDTVETFLKQVYDSDTAAVAVLNDYMTTLFNENVGNIYTSDYYAPTIVNLGMLISEGQVGIAYAQSFAGVLNYSITGASATPSTTDPPTNSGSNNNSGGNQLTIDLTSDSGMVNTMPSIVGFTNIGNGVEIKDILVGQGTAALSNSTVGVYYTGWLAANGTQFDSNRSPNSPISFGLTGTVAGFKAGVAGMQPGGIRQIFIPAAQAYGSSGQGSVPPNADLIFEVKLITTT